MCLLQVHCSYNSEELRELCETVTASPSHHRFVVFSIVCRVNTGFEHVWVREHLEI